MDTVQQVIVIRTKYPDGANGLRKIRSGKIISQACHASMAWLSNRITAAQELPPIFSAEEKEWLIGKFTKICVYVETEDELLYVYKQSQGAGLTTYLIQDSGLTEFNNIPTNTAIGIGPHVKSKLDPITGHLPLY